MFRAQPADDLHSVQPGQHPVDDHGVICAGQCLIQSSVAIMRQVDVESLLTENTGNNPCQALVVFNDQDAHGQTAW